MLYIKNIFNKITFILALLNKMDIILYIGKINIVLGLKGGLVNEKK